MSNVPEWVIHAIQAARLFYGLDVAWLIEVGMVDRPNDSDTTNGCCEADSTYLNARVDLKTGLDAGGEGRRVILHELGHVALAEVEEVILSIATTYIKDQATRTAFLLAHDRALERFLQRLVRAQIPLDQIIIRRQDGPETDPTA